MNEDEIQEGLDNGLNEEQKPLNILGLDVFLTEDLVQSVLPNNLITVDGEDSLSTRIAPYVHDTEVWLTQELIGELDPLLLQPEQSNLAVRCIVMKAVISAIPAIDLVVTPTGFGVVSSNNLAPASKERVERLIASLSASLEGNLISLFDLLTPDPFWREKNLPTALCSTFFRLRDALQIKSDGDIFTRFRNLRDAGREVVDVLESQYLGCRLMRVMKMQYHDEPRGEVLPLTEPIRMASLRYFRSLKMRPSMLPDDHDLWHAAQSVIERLRQFPDLQEMWLSEMGHTIAINPFKNTRKGGYFF